MIVHEYTAVFEPAEEGGYIVHVPALDGLVTHGNTFEEAKSMVEEAIECHLETLQMMGLPIPKDKYPLLERVAVALQ